MAEQMLPLSSHTSTLEGIGAVIIAFIVALLYFSQKINLPHTASGCSGKLVSVKKA